MSRESLLGRDSLDFLSGEAREKRRAALENTAETGRIFRFQEEKLGRCFDYLLYPLKAADGNVSKLVCIIRDITGIKAAKDGSEDLLLRAIVNVMHLAKPCVDKMKKTALNEPQKGYLGIIEMCLDNLIEPLQRESSIRMPKLSATEIQVGSLVKFGMSTKQIAETLNLAAGTVQTYRRRIRKKLGISGKKVKLSSSL
jgi:DNA-binding CsgD family transcriptional regulator